MLAFAFLFLILRFTKQLNKDKQRRLVWLWLSGGGINNWCGFVTSANDSQNNDTRKREANEEDYRIFKRWLHRATPAISKSTAETNYFLIPNHDAMIE